ncbi:hypothetical protein [Nostoc edaphicum]|nr:hypothetical protein [Nostoc edaphicum]
MNNVRILSIDGGGIRGIIPLAYEFCTTGEAARGAVTPRHCL